MFYYIICDVNMCAHQMYFMGSLAPGKFQATARILDPKTLPSLACMAGSLVGSHSAFRRSLWCRVLRRSGSIGPCQRTSWTRDCHDSPIANRGPRFQCLWRLTQICRSLTFLVSMAAGSSMSDHPSRKASCPAEDSKLPIHRHLTAVVGFRNQSAQECIN